MQPYCYCIKIARTHATVATVVQLSDAINVAQCLTCYTLLRVLGSYMRPMQERDFLNCNAGYLATSWEAQWCDICAPTFAVIADGQWTWSSNVS